VFHGRSGFSRWGKIERSTIPRVRSSGADGPRAAPTVALRTASQIEGLVMGGGFGGTIVALAEAEAAPSLVDAVSAASAKRTGREPVGYVCRSLDGAAEASPECRFRWSPDPAVR
jgi:hypothetical protein